MTVCPAGKYQSIYGQTTCHLCPPGFYCAKGAATPVPCPGGTASNATGSSERGACVPVVLGYWAPLGSPFPEPCPASGFYCPGAADDTVNGGSKPIIVPVGDSTTEVQVETVQKEMTLDMSCVDFDIDAVKATLAAQYGVDVALISFANPCATRRRMHSGQPSRRSLAALTLSITITTEATAADGTTVTAPVANLLSAVQAVNDAALAGSLGTALGTTISVTSTTPSTATVSKTKEMMPGCRSPVLMRTG